MDLNFTNLIHFDTIKNRSGLPDADKGGIYMAFALYEVNGVPQSCQLIYIGKAERPTNYLQKRIREHGDVQKNKTFSDHGLWRRNNLVGKDEKIAYCYAPMDDEDMEHLDDIEKKLIFLNQPPGNDHHKDHDNSSIHCPTININLPFSYPIQGYINTWMTT